MVLVIAESHDDRVSGPSLEAIVAALQLGQPITAVIAGHGTTAIAGILSHLPVDEVVQLEDPRLSAYTPDAMVVAFSSLIATMSPSHVVCAHTYQARDYVPRLAARLDRPVVSDCTAISTAGDTITFTRPVFQGKVVADVVLEGPAPHFICTQVGAFRADALAERSTPAPVRIVAASIEDAATRQTVEQPFRESKQDVDLTAASRIVAAGRGIKEEGQLAIVKRLAAVLGAEVAASRPLCDAGWLPMDRQIGSSGQTVAPQLYLALGISGAIQHIVGMKGSRTIVAINKDADAPIFEIADYGIVGDLFDVVPALITALEAH
jgi:electron transfer flavoprotein alpha subunit